MFKLKNITTAVAFFLVSGLVGNFAYAADTIKVGLLSLTSHSPSIIAQGKGYFSDQGLQVEFVSFQAAQPMAIAIASGDVQFGVTAISASLISLAQKDVIRIIGGALTESPDVIGQKILVSKAAYDQGVTTPDKLKGRTFGITTTGSSFHYMAHKIADGSKFMRSELKVKPLQKVPAVIAALKTGQIDAWSIVPNIATGLIKSGTVVEIGKVSDYIDSYQVTTIFTSKNLATGNRDLVIRFLKGFEKGVDTYNAALVDKSLTVAETNEVVGMIHKYVYSSDPIEKAAGRIKAGAMRISPKGRLNLKSVQDQLTWFKSENLVPQSIDLKRLVDTSYVETF